MELISKEEAISKIEQYSKRSCSIYVKTAIKLIDETPTVQSRPKGKWIDNPPDSWICSNCGTHYEERLTFKAHNYCCVCGAEMEKEE